MPVKNLVFVVILAATALVADAVAQKNEVSGTVGRTFIADQAIKGATFFNNNVHFGNGLTFDIDYARHVLGEGFWRISLEVPFVLNWDEDLNTGANIIPKQFRSYFVTPAVRANAFGDSAVSPWGSFGGGFGHFSESSGNCCTGGPIRGRREPPPGSCRWARAWM